MTLLERTICADCNKFFPRPKGTRTILCSSCRYSESNVEQKILKEKKFYVSINGELHRPIYGHIDSICPVVGSIVAYRSDFTHLFFIGKVEQIKKNGFIIRPLRKGNNNRTFLDMHTVPKRSILCMLTNKRYERRS